MFLKKFQLKLEMKQFMPKSKHLSFSEFCFGFNSHAGCRVGVHIILVLPVIL